MRILALDAAAGRCSATLVSSGSVIAGHQRDMDKGQANALPVMARDCLHDAGLKAAELDLFAVTVGPGSFTGIRAAIALAQGLSLAGGRPLVGVTVGETLAAALPNLHSRPLWCATVSRRGRIFLEIEDRILSLAITDLPDPQHPVAIAGNAAIEVASRLAA